MYSDRPRATSCVLEERPDLGRAFSFLYSRMTAPSQEQDEEDPEILAVQREIEMARTGVDELVLHQTRTKKQKWVARAVMIVAFLMFLISVLLVAVTLALTKHFDEMVRNLGEESRTSVKAVPTRIQETINATSSVGLI